MENVNHDVHRKCHPLLTTHVHVLACTAAPLARATRFVCLLNRHARRCYEPSHATTSTPKRQKPLLNVVCKHSTSVTNLRTQRDHRTRQETTTDVSLVISAVSALPTVCDGWMPTECGKAARQGEGFSIMCRHCRQFVRANPSPMFEGQSCPRIVVFVSFLFFVFVYGCVCRIMRGCLRLFGTLIALNSRRETSQADERKWGKYPSDD